MSNTSTDVEKTMPPRLPIMLPRQPVMPKRTAYYASELKKSVTMKKGINGLQMVI